MQDRVQTPPTDSGYDLYIFSELEKPGWRARVAGTQTRAPHPGSTISYQERVYEVVAIDDAPNTAYSFRYMLRAWEDRFPIRQVFPYSLETAHAATARLVQRHRESERRYGAVFWFALTSLLPTPLATRWEKDWGLPMRRAALISMFVIGMSFGVAGPALQNPTFMKVVLFVSLEQVVRFLWWVRSSDAVGSLLLTALWGIWALFAGHDPDGKQLVVDDFESHRDEVKHLTREVGATSPWDLEVRSMLRDPVLLGPSPVRYFGEVYQPLEYIQEGEGIYRRYVFRLKKLDPATPARREYQPQRTPEHVARLVPYERMRDKIHRTGFFCGLLPEAQQTALARNYDYDAGQWCGRTASAFALSAVVQLWTIHDVRFGPPHLFAWYLLLESVYRLVMVHMRGEIVGSVVGYAFAPFFPKK
jgi:hypothetical protein